MNYVRLGNTGLKVSRICLGTMTYGSSQWRDWVLGEADALPFFRQAAEHGINFIDTADMYSLGASEVVTGNAIKEFYPRREDIVVATKVYNPMDDGPNDRGLSRKHIMEAIDASLSRLKMDYVDLYQIHRFDYETPIGETMEALHDVVKAGKARYIGASSMWAWQFARMQHTAEQHGWTKFVSMQNHYNLIYREEEREMIPYCNATGVGLIPWSPVARGFLAGTLKRGEGGTTARSSADPYAERLYRRSDFEWDTLDRVTEVAANHGVKPVQIALAWILHKPGITAPILGVSKPHHMDEAVAALDITLSEQEMAYLEELYQPRSVAGHA